MVDRPGVQAQQCVQLTGTNITYAFYVVFCFCYLFPIALYIHSCLVTIAAGIHPVTSRTRQLSLLAPTILGMRQGKWAVAKLFFFCVSVAQLVRASDC